MFMTDYARVDILSRIYLAGDVKKGKPGSQL